MRFAVIKCSDCHNTWATETRFVKVQCKRCGKTWKLEERLFLWSGDDARMATAAIHTINAPPRKS